MATYKLRQIGDGSFLDELLHSRGITDPTEKIAFLSPNYDEGCHDPFLLKDMQKVVARILKAVEQGEKICIYSDFDADGIPGAVVLHDFFKKISYANTFHYIPDRHVEGFGIHRPALEQIIEQGATLIISIDCGIAEIENSAWIKTQVAKTPRADGSTGIDLIITDHHSPGAVLPDAFAIINPKQNDCQYPEKMLCGSGVIYKVVQALCQTIRERQKAGQKNSDPVFANFPEIKEGWEKWLLDMVGLATLSDMVPLRGENRIFAYFGLTVLRRTPRLGLIKLLKSLKINPAHMNEEDIAFMITPRINAASRMASPMDAFHLLSTDDETEANRLVEHLNNLNTERKTRVAHLVKAIKKSIEERGLQNKDIIVVGNPDWQPPVLGLVATNIVREYNKPVFLWGRGEDEVIKGSCRAPDGFDVVQIMREVPEAEGLFLNLGGHVAAGGYSVSSEKIHFFEEKILEAYKRIGDAVSAATSLDAGIAAENQSILEEKVLGEILIDKVIFTSEVGQNLWSQLEKVGPFGEANPKPVFVLKDVTVIENKFFGKTKEHVELTIVHPDLDGGAYGSGQGGSKVKAIQFFSAGDTKMQEKAVSGAVIDLVAHMEKSMFRGFPEYRLRIIDIL